MSLSRRLAVHFLKTLAAAALLVGGLQPAIPQVRGKGPLALTDGQELRFTAPQFVVHALWFKSNDETGTSWPGSDEVYAMFSDMDPTHGDRSTSVYGDVDEGETRNFLAVDKCMAPQPNCDRGTTALNVRFSFWEYDPRPGWGLSFCPGDTVGGHQWLEHGLCGPDDLIGRGSIIHSREDLVAMLPAIGANREFTAVMDKDAGKYRFRYRITRLDDVTRSIIIHLPPLDPPPPIVLQGTATNVNGPLRVVLTWSGATTGTVDIYRDGTRIVTTANDGSHDDPVPRATYQYRLCNLGSTTVCSPLLTVVV